jgi:hypothetical protein
MAMLAALALAALAGVETTVVRAQDPGRIFVVAGDGHSGPFVEGELATRTPLRVPGGLAALPDGGFLVSDGAQVRRVGVNGRIATVAGTSLAGFHGDGGPATAARIDPGGLTAMPEGGFLIAECANNRIRRVWPDGTITTVAGTGPVAPDSRRAGALPGDWVNEGGFAGDGGPAMQARLFCPVDVDARADGAFLIADLGNHRIRRVDPDGTITTVAGSGPSTLDFAVDYARDDGGLATSARIDPDSVAWMPDGGFALGSGWQARVRRVGRDRLIRTAAGNGRRGRPRAGDGGPAARAAIDVEAMAATADGGFVFLDGGRASGVGSEPTLRRVSPDGILSTIAGTGRYVDEPPRHTQRPGNGGPASEAELLLPEDVAVAADGGLLISEGAGSFSLDSPIRVRYVTPATPALFAAALSRDRYFVPGRPRAFTAHVSAPSSVRVDIYDGSTKIATGGVTADTGTVAVPVGTGLPNRPLVVELIAVQAGGRWASDRLALYPRGWLTDSRARIYANELAPATKGWPSAYAGGELILDCRRFSPTRIDCRAGASENSRCDVVVSVTLRHGGPWWGSYPCPYRQRPAYRDRPRRLRGADLICEAETLDCPRALPAKRSQ